MYDDDYGPTTFSENTNKAIPLSNSEELVLLEEKQGLFGLFVTFEYRAVMERSLKEKLQSLPVVLSGDSCIRGI